MPGACRANHRDATIRSIREGADDLSSARLVRSATTCVAPCARADLIGTASLSPASTYGCPSMTTGGPASSGIAVDALSASCRLGTSWIFPCRSVASPVRASVAIGWNSTGLSRMSWKPIGTT